MISEVHSNIQQRAMTTYQGPDCYRSVDDRAVNKMDIKVYPQKVCILLGGGT